MKFTPGPWILSATDTWTITPEGHAFAIMGNATYYPWVPERIEDWRLIAAAPELYEAVKHLCGVVDIAAPHIPDITERSHVYAIVNAALSLIKKVNE